MSERAVSHHAAEGGDVGQTETQTLLGVDGRRHDQRHVFDLLFAEAAATQVLAHHELGVGAHERTCGDRSVVSRLWRSLLVLHNGQLSQYNRGEENLPDMSSIDIQPVTGRIGAVLCGVDLRRDLAASVVSEIRAALVQHKVIFFRDQKLDAQSHVAFAKHFGEVTTAIDGA